MFLRSLTRSARSTHSLRLLQRSIATSSARQVEQTTQDVKTSFDYHTVEDLQGMSAHEILAETGTRDETKMRHFTGALFLPHFNVQLSDISSYVVNFGFVTPTL